MKMLSLIVISCIISSIHADYCTCPQYQSLSDCTNYSDCKWDIKAGQCQTKTCADYSKDSCTWLGNGTVCFYNGTSCVQAKSCLDITATTATGTQTCNQYGCSYTDGQTSCSYGNCSQQATSSACNSLQQQVWTQNGYFYCYYNSQNKQCQPMPANTPCSERQTVNQCLTVNSTCGWIEQGAQCIDGGCANSQATTSSACTGTSVNNGTCQYNGTTCTFVEQGLSCSKYTFQSVCQTAQYCTWNSTSGTSGTCVNYTCADAKCAGTTVYAYPSGTQDNLIFCEEYEETCATVTANEMGEYECNQMTYDLYTWNGTTCQQCKMGLQVALSLALMAALLALFA